MRVRSLLKISNEVISVPPVRTCMYYVGTGYTQTNGVHVCKLATIHKVEIMYMKLS